MKKLDSVKKEIRVLGVDDGHFTKSEKDCIIVGTVFRGGNYIDGLISSKAEVDGDDATAKIIDMVSKTMHYEQLNCIMLDGIAVAGFNAVDINELSDKTGLPVIVVIRKLPNMKKIYSALKSFLNKEDAEKTMHLIKKAGKIYNVKIKESSIYFQKAGINETKAAEIIRTTATHSLIPEPLRVAHIIASGISKGESKGRA